MADKNPIGHSVKGSNGRDVRTLRQGLGNRAGTARVTWRTREESDQFQKIWIVFTVASDIVLFHIDIIHVKIHWLVPIHRLGNACCSCEMMQILHCFYFYTPVKKMDRLCLCPYVCWLSFGQVLTSELFKINQLNLLHLCIITICVPYTFHYHFSKVTIQGQSKSRSLLV